MNLYFVIEAGILTSTFAVLTVLGGLLIFHSLSIQDNVKLGFVYRPLHVAVLIICFSFAILSIDSQGALRIWPWAVRFFPWLIVYNTGFIALSYYLMGIIFVLNESTGRSSKLASHILTNQKMVLAVSSSTYLSISLLCDILAIAKDQTFYRGIWIALCGFLWVLIAVFLTILLRELHKRIDRVRSVSDHDNSFQRNYKRLQYTTAVSIFFSLYLIFLGVTSMRDNLSVAHQPPFDNTAPAPFYGLISGAILMIYVVHISWIPICTKAAKSNDTSKTKEAGPPKDVQKMSTEIVVGPHENKVSVQSV
jgi:hypothetical protein